MKKDTLKALVQSDDLWRWAERNGPDATKAEKKDPEKTGRWWRRWFSRSAEQSGRVRLG